MKLLAYSVTTAFSEASVLVFASSRGRAKSLAMSTDWLADESFTDLVVSREPLVDLHAETYGEAAIDASTPHQCAILRRLGWYELTNDRRECESCGFFPWLLVEMSALDERGICGLCRADPEIARVLAERDTADQDDESCLHISYHEEAGGWIVCDDCGESERLTKRGSGGRCAANRRGEP